MPTNQVKNKRQERLWNQAKQQVSDEYPDVDDESDRYWALVSGIYQRMKKHQGGMKKSRLLLRRTVGR